ncbi:MAG: hypothetical protein ACM3US_11560 [Sphingomonadaceae bacterium]
MGKVRLASMLTGIAVIVALLPGTVLGFESQAADQSKVTSEEIQSFVDGVYAGKVSSAEVVAFHARLSAAEKDVLLDKTAAKAGMSAKDVAELKARIKQSKSGTAPAPATTDSTPLPWSGSILLASYDGYSPRGYGSYWYQDSNADGDPSDVDYVDHIPFSWSDVSLINWYSDDAIVLNGLMAAYQSDLSGFTSSYDWMRMVIGDLGSRLAGGMDRITSGLYLW